MRVRVDENKCQGHTLCTLAAPGIFVLSDEDGHSTAPDENVPAGREQDVRGAASTCPEQAIIVED